MESATVKLSALIMICLVTSILAGAAASAYVLPGGGYLSTQTSVSVTGSVNDTVSIKYSTLNDGFLKKTTWESSYINQTPARHTLSSRLDLGSLYGNFWWNFQRTGLPVALLAS